MSSFPRMLYQVGDQEEMHGGRFNYITVDDASALEAMLESGWYLTTCEATAAAAVPAPVVVEPAAVEPVLTEPEASLLDRSSLEARATELGIKFDGRTSDRKLNTLIIEKLG